MLTIIFKGGVETQSLKTTDLHCSSNIARTGKVVALG